jgi:hypothetical protein
MLLVIGDWKLIRQLQQQMHDFVVLNLPAEVDDVAPAVSQAPHALFLFGVNGRVDAYRRSTQCHCGYRCLPAHG